MKRSGFFTKEEKKIIILITFSDNWELLGSQADPKFRYTSDFDVMETLFLEKSSVKNDAYMGEALAGQLKHKVEKIHRMKNVYLGDIKAGTHKGEKLRWNRKTISQGYQMSSDGKKIYLKNAINQVKADFKIDLVGWLPTTGSYHEFSNVIIRDKTDQKNIKQELEKEYKEKLKEGKYYKAIKRQYSLLSFLGKENNAKGKKLLSIITYPPLGAFHQINEGLNTLIYLLENHKIKKTNKKFLTNLEGFKKWLWESYGFWSDKIGNLVNELNEIISNPSLKELKNYQELVSNILNIDAFKKTI